MQILLAPAKLMIDSPSECPLEGSHTPVFQSEADNIAACLCNYDVRELIDMLHINKEIAISARRRYNDFFDKTTRRAAITRYDGIVFKKIDAVSLSAAQLKFADNHINICSFIYGLLRPLDAINPYRLEGDVSLPCIGGISIFEYWQSRLTEELIRRTKADDGILVNLASDEMRRLFDWKRITKELTVISPSFKVEKDGKLRTIVVYAKMCRGAMTRYIVSNMLTSPDAIPDFTFEGFTYAGGTFSAPLFALQS